MKTTYPTAYGDFEWDSEKEAANRRKHGISFVDAVVVFKDEQRFLVYDSAHSEDEDRYILLGRLREFHIVVVVYTERDSHYRIISARLATKSEVRTYERQLY